jgi:hypothetical protein
MRFTSPAATKYLLYVPLTWYENIEITQYVAQMILLVDWIGIVETSGYEVREEK